MRLSRLLVLLMIGFFPTAYAATENFSADFASAKKRPKTILLLPIEAKLSLYIDDVGENLDPISDGLNNALFSQIETHFIAKGFKVIKFDPKATFSDPKFSEAAALIPLLLEEELENYDREPKALRYNWYGLGLPPYILANYFDVDAVAIARVFGGYNGTSPSAEQYAKNMGANATKSAIRSVLSGGKFGVTTKGTALSALTTGADKVEANFLEFTLTIVDGESGKFDAHFYAKERMLDSKSFRTLISQREGSEKVFDAKSYFRKELESMTKKALKRLPHSKKSVRVSIKKELREVKPRRSLKDQSPS